MDKNESKEDDRERRCAKRISVDTKQNVCFIWNGEDKRHNLQQVETFKTCENLKVTAHSLNDTVLLSKFAGPDMVAQELKYHPRCYTQILKRQRSEKKKKIQQDKDDSGTLQKDIFAVAFSDLLSYIHERRLISKDQPTIFRLVDLVKLMSEWLQQLGVQRTVISTRLKDLIIEHIPEIEAYKKGRDIVTAFNNEVGLILAVVNEYDDAIIVSKAAQILRQQILSTKCRFQGSFDTEYCDDSILPQLLNFISGISHGTGIQSHMECGISKADAALA